MLPSTHPSTQLGNLLRSVLSSVFEQEINQRKKGLADAFNLRLLLSPQEGDENHWNEDPALFYTYTLQALAREISTLRGAFEERKPLRMREGLLKAIALSLFLE